MKTRATRDSKFNAMGQRQPETGTLCLILTGLRRSQCHLSSQEVYLSIDSTILFIHHNAMPA